MRNTTQTMPLRHLAAGILILLVVYLVWSVTTLVTQLTTLFLHLGRAHPGMEVAHGGLFGIPLTAFGWSWVAVSVVGMAVKGSTAW